LFSDYRDKSDLSMDDTAPWEFMQTLAAEPLTVNDITQLNPIVVEGIAGPQTVDEIRQLVREHQGSISIGGGRYSMGGQIATDSSGLLLPP
jgi:hypothetical protein